MNIFTKKKMTMKKRPSFVSIKQRIVAIFTVAVMLLQICLPTVVWAASILSNESITVAMASPTFQKSATNAYLYEQASFDDASYIGSQSITSFRQQLVAAKTNLGKPTFIPIASDITIFIPTYPTGKLIGDAYVQNRYIRQQVFDLLGRHLIYAASSNISEVAQINTLYDAAFAFAKANPAINFGANLDATTLANLMTDMIWPEIRIINNENVVVPILYLTTSTVNTNKVSKNLTEFMGSVADLGSITLNHAELTLGATTIVTTAGNLTATNDSLIGSRGDINLVVGGTLNLIGSKITGVKDVKILANEINVKTVLVPFKDRYGSGTKLGSIASINSATSISLASTGNINFEGAIINASNGSLTIDAAQNISIQPLFTSYQREYVAGHWQVSASSLDVIGSRLSAQDKITLVAGGGIEINASELISTQGGIELLAQQGIYIVDELTQEQIQRVDRKGRTTGQSSEFRTEAVRSILKAGKGVLLNSESGDVTLKATEITSVTGTEVTAKNGKVHLLMTKELEEFHLQTVRKGTWTIKTRTEDVIHENNIQNAIVGGLQVQAKYGINVEYTGKEGATLKEQIEEYRKMPEMKWMADLYDQAVTAGGQSVNWQVMEEVHQELKKTKRNLSPAAMAIIAICVAVVTGGAGIGMLGAIKGAVIFATEGIIGAAAAAALGAAMSAGALALSTQAAQSLAAGNNLREIVNAMDSDESLRSLAIAMATAGALENADIDMFTTAADSKNLAVSLSGQAAQTMVNATITAGISVSINGGNSSDYLDAFKVSLATNAVNTIGQNMSTKIGDLATSGDFNTAAKYIAHAGVGCLIGVASAKAGGADTDVGSNCSTGAGGAVVGEYVGDIYKKRLANDLNSWALKLIDPVTSPYDPRIDVQMEILSARGVDVAKLSAALGAFFSGGDVNTAVLTAINAAKYNATNERHRKIYRWVDKNGLVHFGDKWPAGANVGIDLNTLGLPEESVRARAAAQQKELNCIFNKTPDCVPEKLNFGDQSLEAQIKEKFPEQFTEEATLARRAVSNELASMDQTLKQTSEIGCTVSLLCGSVVALQEVIDGRVVTVGSALVVIDIFGNKILKTGEGAVDWFKSTMQASGGPKNLTPTQTSKFWSQIDDEMIGMPTYNLSNFENGRYLRAGALNAAHREDNRLNPYKEGTVVSEFFTPPGTKFYAIEKIDQTSPGIWASKRRYTNLEEARQDLAIPPEWKSGTLVVREYTVNANVNLPTRSGITGEQSENDVLYKGGATQYEFAVTDIWRSWESYLTLTNKYEIK